MLKNFTNIGKYHQRVYSVQLLTLIGLIVLPWHYLLISLILLIPTWHAFYIITHDYIAHQYIKPKNALSQLFVLGFITLLTGEALLDKKNYHMVHHTKWNTSLDPTYRMLDSTPFWKYVLNWYPTPLTPIEHVISKLANPIDLWINNNADRIYYGGIILSFIFMPLWMFFAVHVYLRFMLTTLGHSIDFYYHKTPDQDLSKDMPALVPILGSGARHIYHHKFYNQVDYGGKILKYFNPGWYLTLILFTPNSP